MLVERVLTARLPVMTILAILPRLPFWVQRARRRRYLFVSPPLPALEAAQTPLVMFTGSQPDCEILFSAYIVLLLH